MVPRQLHLLKKIFFFFSKNSSDLHPVFLLLVDEVILAQVTRVTFRAISEEKEDMEHGKPTESQG
jgi:hypothetical protein